MKIFKKEKKNNYEKLKKDKSNSKIYRFIFWLAIIGLIGIIVYSYTHERMLLWLSSSIFIGLASYLVGSLIGFLFGIPKVNSNFSSTTNKEYIANYSQ